MVGIARVFPSSPAAGPGIPFVSGKEIRVGVSAVGVKRTKEEGRLTSWLRFGILFGVRRAIAGLGLGFGFFPPPRPPRVPAALCQRGKSQRKTQSGDGSPHSKQRRERSPSHRL